MPLAASGCRGGRRCVIQIRWNYNAELDLNCLPTRAVELGRIWADSGIVERLEILSDHVPAGNEGARQFVSRTSIQGPYEIDESSKST